MQKPVIAVDFDDVIVIFNRAYIAFHNAQYGSPRITYENIYTFDMCKLYNVDETTMVERIRRFCVGHHDQVVPYAGVWETLRVLSRTYQLHLVTSRCETLRGKTLSLLRDYDLFDRFQAHHFTNGFASYFPQRYRSKLAVCKQIGAQLLVDDSPDTALHAAEGGVSVLMPRRPWNAHVTHANITRFSVWHQVPSLLSDVSVEV